MKEKRGFTLIELLAVIVILAIIALIATPIILNLINQARKGAFKRSAEGVLKSAKLTYSASLLKEDSNISGVYACNDITCESNEKDENNNPLSTLNVEGNMGTGEVHIEKDGNISLMLTNGTYCAVKYLETSQIFVYDGNCDNIDISTDESAPLVDINHYIKTSNSIQLSIAASDPQSTIKGYSCKLGDGDFSEIVQNNVCKFEGLTPDTQYTITVRVYNKLPNKDNYIEANNMTEASISITTDSVGTPSFTLTPNDDRWMQARKVTITYNGGTGVTSTYSIKKESDETEVQGDTEGTEVIVEENGLCVVAKNADTNNNTKTNTWCSSRIDRSQTTVTYQLNKTSNSITITAVGVADSGIHEYLFSKDGGTTWDASNVTGYNNKHEYTGLTTDTYNIQVKAINNAYYNTLNNEVLSSRKSDLGIGTNTVNVTLDGCSIPEITFEGNNANTWTKSKTVNVGLPNNATLPTGFKIQYITDSAESNWTDYTNPVVFNANGYIGARVTDGVNTCAMSNTTAVDKIDTNSPTVTLVNEVASIDGITINTTMSDGVGESGLATPICLYGTSSGSYTTNCTTKTDSVSTITGLDTGATYYYQICAVDLAGNNDNCITGSVTTSQPTASDIYYNNATYTGGNDITVQSALEYLYSQLN